MTQMSFAEPCFEDRVKKNPDRISEVDSLREEVDHDRAGKLNDFEVNYKAN